MSTQLPIDEALALIERAQKLSPHRPWRLTVAIANPGGLTAHQTVEVETIHQGFDWTASQLIVKPAQPLSVLTPEQLVELGESARQGQSWHAYQRDKANRAELKERDERISELESKLSEALRQLEEARKALIYWRDECSGAEPSISVFSRMVDEFFEDRQ
jgi:hypothetical protein